MKEQLLSGWTFWRSLRMILALIFIMSGAFRAEFILIAAGSYLFFQSLFNLGCAGRNCAVAYKSKDHE